MGLYLSIVVIRDKDTITAREWLFYLFMAVSLESSLVLSGVAE